MARLVITNLAHLTVQSQVHEWRKKAVSATDTDCTQLNHKLLDVSGLILDNSDIQQGNDINNVVTVY